MMCIASSHPAERDFAEKQMCISAGECAFNRFAPSAFETSNTPATPLHGLNSACRSSLVWRLASYDSLSVPESLVGDGCEFVYRSKTILCQTPFIIKVGQAIKQASKHSINQSTNQPTKQTVISPLPPLSGRQPPHPSRASTRLTSITPTTTYIAEKNRPSRIQIPSRPRKFSS